MPDHTPSASWTGNDSRLLVFILSFLVPLALYVFRHLDDNRLTSWKWAFSVIDAPSFFFILIGGIITAYIISTSRLPEKYPVPFLLVLSYAAGMLMWSEPEVIIDTSRYFTQAKHLEVYGIRYFFSEWGGQINAWTDMPLISFLYGLFFRFFGENRICIQVVTTAIFSMSVLTTYFLGKILWNEFIGFYGGIMLTGIPYLLSQVPLMLVDVATMFFITLAVVTFIMALERGGIWLFISSSVIFLAFFTKYSAWPMLTVLAIVLAVHLWQRSGEGRIHNEKSTYIRRGVSVALITITCVSILALNKIDLIIEQVNILLTYQKPALKGWSESYTSTYLFQTHPFITAAALLSVPAALKKRDMRYMIICWLVLLMFSLSVKRIRYILPVFPMLTLMAAYGLQEISDRKVAGFIAFSAVISSLIFAAALYLPFLKEMGPANIQHAGDYLNDLDEPRVEVWTLPPKSFNINPAVSVPILDLYTSKHIHYKYIDIQPPESVRESPLRFTWTYNNPAYYSRSSETARAGRPLAIISSETGQSLPPGLAEKTGSYEKTREFNKTTGLFRYSPTVMIFDRNTD